MNNEIQKKFTERFAVQTLESTPEFSKLIEDSSRFFEVMMMYRCAIREVRTKFEVLDDELSVRCQRNPIEFITSRIKKPQSILEKLERKGLDFSMKSIVESLNDVAGIRVVCSFIDDIYDIADMLAAQDDITLLEVKDYIKSPKPNGYRSYHMIVEIPVFFSDRKRPIRVEVQLRTIAMDFWSSLEHQLKYKKDVPDAEIISQELKECASVIANTDERMQNIKNRIYPQGQNPSTIFSPGELFNGKF